MTKRSAGVEPDLQNVLLPYNKILVQEDMPCSTYQMGACTGDPLCLVTREESGCLTYIKPEKDSLDPDPLCLVKKEEPDDEQGSYSAESPMIEPLVVIKEEQDDTAEVPSANCHYMQPSHGGRSEEDVYQGTSGPVYSQLQGAPAGVNVEQRLHLHHHHHFHQQPDTGAFSACSALSCTRSTHDGTQKDILLRSSSVSLFKKPLRFQLTQPLYRCGGCGRVFSHLDGYRTHLHTHVPGVPYCCFWCGTAFSMKKTLHDHQLEAPNGGYVCKLCHETFKTMCKLRKHELCEIGRKLAHSNQWGFHPACAPEGLAVILVIFESSIILDRVCTHHGDEPFSCWRCGKSYGLAKNLQKHEDLHRAERPYECDHCPACFCTKGQWLRHSWVHIGKMSVTCPVCGEAFDSATKLADHEKRHEQSQGSDICACGLVCADKTKMSQHQRVCFHANDKCYTCGMCNASFGQRGLLVRHSFQHKSSHSFTCDECGKAQSHTNYVCDHTNNRGCDNCGYFAEHFGRHIEHLMVCGKGSDNRGNGQVTSTSDLYILYS